jgi:CRP-like cAMP-binding protein
VRFDDYPVAASPPQGVNPCDDCALRRLEAFLPASPEELKTIQSFRVGARRVEAGGSIIEEHRLFHAQPKLGYDITWLAAREEKMVDDNLVTTGRRNAGERVAMLLMHLYRRAERVGMVRDGWVEFPFNQQHIADALGLSLVHTNKTLRRLQRQGLHKLDAGWLRILEPHALEALGDYFERPLRPVPLI